MYTDETVLDYGKYKGKKLKDIPNQYFINIYRSGDDNHVALKEYIETNKERFHILVLHFIKKDLSPPVTFICEKRTYPTKKAAMDSIVKPISKPKKPVPIRAYECPECSGWHLTSKEIEKFKSK